MVRLRGSKILLFWILRVRTVEWERRAENMIALGTDKMHTYVCVPIHGIVRFRFEKRDLALLTKLHYSRILPVYIEVVYREGELIGTDWSRRKRTHIKTVGSSIDKCCSTSRQFAKRPLFFPCLRRLS